MGDEKDTTTSHLPKNLLWAGSYGTKISGVTHNNNLCSQLKTWLIPSVSYSGKIEKAKKEELKVVNEQALAQDRKISPPQLFLLDLVMKELDLFSVLLSVGVKA